jgi:site-specific DNA-cytosine methylase
MIEPAMSNHTKRLKALGNSVVPDCAEWMGLQILAHARREEKGEGKETAGVVPLR